MILLLVSGWFNHIYPLRFSSGRFNLAPLCAQAMSDKDSLQNMINEALRFHKNGQFNEATSKYEAILQNVSNNSKLASTLHSNIGAIYMNNLGDIEAARRHFTAAVLHSPDNSPHLLS